MSKEILGRGAFRRETNASKPINMNIFETTLYFMTLANNKNLSFERIEQGLRQVINNDIYLWCIGNSRDDPAKVTTRFALMDQLYKEICND
jgi:hypothetical protein